MKKQLKRFRRCAFLRVELTSDDIMKLPDNQNLDEATARNFIETAVFEGDFKTLALSPIETWIIDKWIRV